MEISRESVIVLLHSIKNTACTNFCWNYHPIIASFQPKFRERRDMSHQEGYQGMHFVQNVLNLLRIAD